MVFDFEAGMKKISFGQLVLVIKFVGIGRRGVKKATYGGGAVDPSDN